MSNKRKFVEKTPLCVAIDNNNIKEVKSLLQNGAMLQEEEPQFFIKAVQQQSEELVNLLLDHGAEINTTDEFGGTALYYCFKLLYVIHEEFPSFVEHDYNTWNKNAARNMIKLLLERGADPNISKYKYFPLHTAIVESDVDIINALIKYKADVHCQDSRRRTPLHIALAVNLTNNSLDDLLACYHDIDIPNIEGRTPLYYTNNSDVLSRLLSKKCIVNHIDNNGDTPLHYMCEQHDKLDCIKMLLEHGADVNALNKEGQTPFHKLTKFQVSNLKDLKNSTHIVNELLKYNADINAVDHEGNTPLILACETTVSINTFATFLDYGAEVNCNNKYGKTPLHLVVESLQKPKIEILLTYGADINILCNDNKTAFDYLKLKVNEINFSIRSKDKCSRGHMPMRISFIYKSVRDHVVSLKCAGLHVNNNNIDLFYNENGFVNPINSINVSYNINLQFNISDIVRIENNCNDEISRLKNTVVDGVVLNNLFSINHHDLMKFTENKEFFCNLLNNYDICNQFPVYGTIIKNRLKEAVEMSEIIDIAKKYFDSLEIINELPLLCREKILRYLNLRDLRVLLKAVQSSKITSNVDIYCAIYNAMLN